MHGGEQSCSADGRPGLKIGGGWLRGMNRDKGNAQKKKKSDQAEKKD